MNNLISYQIIVLIIFILNTSSNIITVPFKIAKNYEINDIENHLSFIETFREHPLYTNISLGEPPKSIISIISFYTFEFSIYHRKNKRYFNQTTLYKRNNSKTFETINYKNPSRKVQYFKEQVSFYTDLNFENTIKVKDLLFSFIENSRDKKEVNDDSLCINIGLQLSENSDDKKYNKDLNTNLIIQLKQKSIISTYSFNFHFQKITINEEDFDGFIVLGNEPHQYLKNSYNEQQLFKTLAFKKDNQLSWDMHFNKVFYLRGTNFKKTIDKNIDFYNQGTLSPSSSLIVGTLNYEENIKFEYFQELISFGKCRRESKQFTIFYYCYKNKTTEEDLKKFPTLNFYNSELDYTFELTYKDLFFEKGNFIYFYIIFYNFPEDAQNYFWSFISRWELGMPFMRKYFFTYDYDGKYIGFYNTKKIIINKDINKYNNKRIKHKSFLWIIIPIIFAFILGIFFIRKYIFKNRKIKATELENNDINGKNSNMDNYNYHSVEMKQKILIN